MASVRLYNLILVNWNQYFKTFQSGVKCGHACNANIFLVLPISPLCSSPHSLIHPLKPSPFVFGRHCIDRLLRMLILIPNHTSCNAHLQFSLPYWLDGDRHGNGLASKWIRAIASSDECFTLNQIWFRNCLPEHYWPKRSMRSIDRQRWTHHGMECVGRYNFVDCC